MEKVKIYHHPKCSTSRNTLNLLKHMGLDVQVVLYMDNHLSPDELSALLDQMGMSAAELIRTKTALDKQIDIVGLDERALIHLMCEDPSLMNRPIVVSDRGAILARPIERIFDLLETPLRTDFQKENGSLIQARA